MKKLILIIVVSAGFLHAEPPATNGLDAPVMPPAKSQCPPSNRPGWHQRDDGKWIKN